MMGWFVGTVMRWLIVVWGALASEERRARCLGEARKKSCSGVGEELRFSTLLADDQTYNCFSLFLRTAILLTHFLPHRTHHHSTSGFFDRTTHRRSLPLFIVVIFRSPVATIARLAPFQTQFSEPHVFYSNFTVVVCCFSLVSLSMKTIDLLHCVQLLGD